MVSLKARKLVYISREWTKLNQQTSRKKDAHEKLWAQLGAMVAADHFSAWEKTNQSITKQRLCAFYSTHPPKAKTICAYWCCACAYIFFSPSHPYCNLHVHASAQHTGNWALNTNHQPWAVLATGDCNKIANDESNSSGLILCSFHCQRLVAVQQLHCLQYATLKLSSCPRKNAFRVFCAFYAWQ